MAYLEDYTEHSNVDWKRLYQGELVPLRVGTPIQLLITHNDLFVSDEDQVVPGPGGSWITTANIDMDPDVLTWINHHETYESTPLDGVDWKQGKLASTETATYGLYNGQLYLVNPDTAIPIFATPAEDIVTSPSRVILYLRPDTVQIYLEESPGTLHLEHTISFPDFLAFGGCSDELIVIHDFHGSSVIRLDTLQDVNRLFRGVMGKYGYMSNIGEQHRVTTDFIDVVDFLEDTHLDHNVLVKGYTEGKSIWRGTTFLVYTHLTNTYELAKLYSVPRQVLPFENPQTVYFHPDGTSILTSEYPEGGEIIYRLYGNLRE